MNNLDQAGMKINILHVPYKMQDTIVYKSENKFLCAIHVSTGRFFCYQSTLDLELQEYS